MFCWRILYPVWVTQSETHLEFKLTQVRKLHLEFKLIQVNSIQLKEEFPRLYQISNQKTCLISELRGDGEWDLQFRRLPFVGEAEQQELLKQRLQGIILDPSKPDVVRWRWLGDGRFTVRSAYDKWESLTYSNNDTLGSLWRNLGPRKVEILAWLAVKAKTVTRSVLLRMNILQTEEEASCLLCTQQVETH